MIRYATSPLPPACVEPDAGARIAATARRTTVPSGRSLRSGRRPSTGPRQSLMAHPKPTCRPVDRGRDLRVMNVQPRGDTRDARHTVSDLTLRAGSTVRRFLKNLRPGRVHVPRSAHRCPRTPEALRGARARALSSARPPGRFVSGHVMRRRAGQRDSENRGKRWRRGRVVEHRPRRAWPQIAKASPGGDVWAVDVAVWQRPGRQRTRRQILDPCPSPQARC